MSKNRNYVYFIPSFFIMLSISSLISIIGNAILLRSDLNFSSNFGFSQFPREWLIFRIILSSILTVIFIIFAIFSFLEVDHTAGYKSKIFDDKLEKKYFEFIYNAKSYEILLLHSEFIILPIGIANFLIVNSTNLLIVAIIIFAFVYYTYYTRLSITNAIKKVLPKNPDIKLNDLSKLISRDRKRVKSSLLELIAYYDFPAKYDYKTDIIHYNTNINENKEAIITNPKNKSRDPCPYCDSIPLVSDALFCSQCGSSLVSVK